MTTILPGETSPWQVIDRSIGRQLSQNLPGAVQQGYQRQQGLNAIDQLQAELAQSGGDITKMLPAIARAYTLNPALERSGIAEKLIPLAQRAESTKEGAGKSRGPTKTTQAGEESPLSVSDLIQPRQSQIQDPTGVSQYQLPYGPEEINSIRMAARQKGYLPEIEERLVNDAKEYNQIAQTRRDIELQNYQQQQKQREDTIANQALFTNYLNENAPEFTNNPDERELALKASEKYQKETSFANRLAKVKEELRPYQASKKALEKTLKRPLLGQTREQRNLARPRARMMVEAGQKPQLQLMIANGGSGEVEEADLLNPLPESFERNLDKFNRFITPLEAVSNIDPESPEYQKQLENGLKRRESQKGHMVDFLSNHITSGSYKDPGTNLLLTRYHLMQKGLGYDEAGKLIDDAIAKGQIKLDPQQKIDYQKLAYPPLTADTYLDTVLNNLLFPITGRQ